jgi:hypothetical protein
MKIFVAIIFLLLLGVKSQAQLATQWMKYEIDFQSEKEYADPIYDVKGFKITFFAPSGRQRTVRGYWDGGKNWKVRFCPDEVGSWKWESSCTDTKNSGLHNLQGTFDCQPNGNNTPIFKNGSLIHPAGKYYLAYSNGTPFFWLACTAWNGALKSTDEEWEYYLNHRIKHKYTVIQIVTTEWRGCDKNAEGLTAIEGTGHIKINPEFFKRIDQKIDEANSKGLIVSPVILWALPSGSGRHLSPGYTLPLEEAVILAQYIVARYQGNQVIWTLGGDGKYYDDQEIKWKEIGRRVFNDIDHAPVTLHPHGISWVGELFIREKWYDLAGYQSSHSNGEGTVNWINKGPMSKMWSVLKPVPYINMEPNYEEIGNKITDTDVRNASWWSLFATPIAGVTYGANGIWPWLRNGESILNHGNSSGTTNWRKSLDFPGSIQMGYLGQFMSKLEWWRFNPANELLEKQPGNLAYNHWISVMRKDDHSEILVYIPIKESFCLFNPEGFTYEGHWFNPVTNLYSQAKLSMIPLPEPPPGNTKKGVVVKSPIIGKSCKIEIEQNFENDMVLILRKI